MDPAGLEELITPRTKAIMPVHLYGHACDMKSICDIARKYKLFVLEDCAEAIGTTINGQRVGSFGDISAFSFLEKLNTLKKYMLNKLKIRYL